MFNSFAPIDILIFAAIACFVLYRLYRQLGSRVDLEDQDTPSMNAFDQSPSGQKKAQQKFQPLFSPDVTSSESDGKGSEDRFAVLHKWDEDIDEKSFLEGASIAYDMILTGLAQGDTKILKPLLSADLFDNFCAEIKRRRSEGHVHETELVGIGRMYVRDLRVDDAIATIEVEIESEQTFAVYDSERNLIEGSAEELQDVFEVWYFQRNMASANPNWNLVYIETEYEEPEDTTSH